MSKEIDPERGNVLAALGRLYAARLELQRFGLDRDHYTPSYRRPVLRTTHGILGTAAFVSAMIALAAWFTSSASTTGPAALARYLWTAATLAPVSAFLLVLSLAVYVHGRHLSDLADHVEIQQRHSSQLAARIDEVIRGLERWLKHPGRPDDSRTL